MNWLRGAFVALCVALTVTLTVLVQADIHRTAASETAARDRAAMQVKLDRIIRDLEAR